MFENLLHTPVVVVSSDSLLTHQLNHLFHVVLRCDVQIRDTLADLLVKIEGRRANTVILFHAQGYEAKQQMGLFKRVKGMLLDPTIIVLCDDDPGNAIYAFYHGADDVIHWPSSLAELAMRVSVRLGHPLSTEMLDVAEADWEVLNFISDKANLTLAEAQVLRVLYERQGETVSREDLSLAINERPWEYGDRKFDVHVAKIRKKFESAFGSAILVSTVRASGYLLTTEKSRIDHIS